MIFGATITHFWERRNPKSFEMYGFALAAGLVAGEGMGGVMNAILAIANVDGSQYGTSIGSYFIGILNKDALFTDCLKNLAVRIGCPSLEYCG